MSTLGSDHPEAGPATPASRRWPWRICAILAAILLVVGNLGMWSYRTISDTDRFVAVTQQVFAREDVRDAVATRIVDQLMPDSRALRRLVAPTIVPVVSGVLRTDSFQALLGGAAAQLHLALTKGQPIAITIDSNLLRDIAFATARTIAPDQAQVLTPVDGVVTIELFSDTEIPSYQREIQILKWAGLIGGIVGLVLLVLPVAVRRDRWSFGIAGLALVGTALGTFAAMWLMGWLLDRQISDPQVLTLIAAIGDRLFDQLIRQALVVLGIGTVLAVVGLIRRPGTAMRA